MKKRVKVLSMFLCFALLFTVFAVANPVQEAEARTLAQVDADINQYQALLNQLQGTKSDLTSKIDDLNQQSSYTTEQLNIYIEQIEYIEAEIAITEETIAAYNLKLAEIEASIIVEEENLAYYKDMYAQIVRHSFVEGSTSYFELLFESENFSDFLSKVDNLNYILDYTDTVLKEIEIATADLETTKANHESAKQVLDTYQADLESQNTTLAQAKADLEAKAAELGTSLAQMKSQYVSANSQITEVKAKIEALKKERIALLETNKDFIWPLRTNFYISSTFGWRSNPFGGSGTEFHNGLDLPSPSGTPIYAAKGGTVTKAQYSGGYGNCVVISHGDGTSTLYGHASSLAVSAGQVVKQGDVIAYVGTTGRSTGNHLHFTLMVNGVAVDPIKYLPKR